MRALPTLPPFFYGIFTECASRNFSAVKCKVRGVCSAAWNKACLCRHFETFIRAENTSLRSRFWPRSFALLFFVRHNLLYGRAARANCISPDTLLGFFPWLRYLRDEPLQETPVLNYVANTDGFAADLELAFLSPPCRFKLSFLVQM